MWELAGLEHIDQVLKPNPPPPERESSVFASARSMSGDGTRFITNIFNVTMPAGSNLLFGGFWSDAIGVVTPASGDQDLFLDVFAPGIVLSASRLAGTATDAVVLQSVSAGFVWIRFFGFRAGVIKKGIVNAGTWW
jgi:hypothetical protein